MPFHLSPTPVGLEDDVSLDSAPAGGSELGDALIMARDKQIISKALDTIARIQSLNLNDLSSVPSEERMYDYDSPILQEQHINFSLQSPGPVPPYLNIHYVCESGSRLLFLCVHWSRNLPAFQYLSTDTQISILRGCWVALFALGLSQCSQSLGLPAIIAALSAQLNTMIAQDKMSAAKVNQIADHILRLQDCATSMQSLHVDDQEYAYMRAITLFSVEQLDATWRKHVEKLHVKSYMDLQNYQYRAFPEDTGRCSK